jgi:hypothetical protein
MNGMEMKCLAEFEETGIAFYRFDDVRYWRLRNGGR